MKIRIGWVMLICALGLTSCKTEKKTPGVLSKQELAEVLIGIYEGEARMVTIPVVNDSAFKLFRPFEEALLQEKGIHDSVMKITYRYYVEHPVELEQVYDIVIDTLSLREQKAGIKPKRVGEN
jgi:hypothetical protein